MVKTCSKIMGILNVTPDSFYDKGKFESTDLAIEQGIEMYRAGADIIDVGGESTRPGSSAVSEKEELDRVLPVLRALKNEVPIPLSIDTLKPKVAEAAIDEGASLINDVSGCRDPKMISLAAECHVPICIMHMQGSPKTMQDNPYYPNGVVADILSWMQSKIEELVCAGIKEENIVIDPGIGFGKTVDDNLKIIHNLHVFQGMGYPVLVGLSRKSFMSKIINKPACDTLATTLAMNTLAMANGANIIRVHDIIEHRNIADVYGRLIQVN